MSKVNLSDITYPYINLNVLDEQAEYVGINLQKVYSYINKHKNMGSPFPNGNAYRIIRKRANKLIGRADVKVSKREVSSLISRKQLFRTKYVKIPYKMDYIFRAIFEIVDELKIYYPLPKEVEHFIGTIRRDSFYEIQSSLYRAWYEEKKEIDKLDRALYDDIFSGNSVLSKEF